MKHYVALAIILTVIVSVVLTIPTVLASRQLLIWLNTPDDILVMADAYIKVILREFSAPCPTMWLPVFAKYRRQQDSAVLFDFSSVLNIVLDIFFIVVVKAGTAGAAYATVISQGIAAVLSFIVMFKKYDLLRTSREDYYMDWSGIWRMLSIGLQMALNYSITAIGTMILSCGQCLRFAGGSCVYRRIQGQQYRDTDNAYTWNSRCDLLRTKSRCRQIRQDI